MVLLSSMALWLLSSREKQDLPEPFPPSLPAVLSLTSQELPDNYKIAEDKSILEGMDLEKNPGYLTLQAEQTALIQRGGLCSIAALYAQDDKVRLMLNAVYFRNHEDASSFVEIERKKKRKMAAFRKVLPSSVWLIFIAADEEQTYSDAERFEFREMLHRYQDRLKLDALFDFLSQEPQGV